MLKYLIIGTGLGIAGMLLTSNLFFYAMMGLTFVTAAAISSRSHFYSRNHHYVTRDSARLYHRQQTNHSPRPQRWVPQYRGQQQPRTTVHTRLNHSHFESNVPYVRQRTVRYYRVF